MKILILLSLSFNIIAGSFHCESKIEKHLGLISAGVHETANQSEKRLNLSYEAIKAVHKCLEDKCELKKEQKEKLFRFVSDSHKVISNEYEKYYKLQASNLDEIQRDAYMDDARSYVESKTKAVLLEVKNVHKQVPLTRNLFNNRASGKDTPVNKKGVEEGSNKVESK
jgi:hypothetical protein